MSHTKIIPRRRFLLLVGAGAIVGTSVPLVMHAADAKPEKRAFDPRVPLMRNAAFTLKKEGGKSMLVTQRPTKEMLAYELDTDAEFLWRNLPTGEEFTKGKKVTAEQIAGLAIKNYPAKKPEVIRKEVMDFLKEAHALGVVVDEQARVYVAYKPAR